MRMLRVMSTYAEKVIEMKIQSQIIRTITAVKRNQILEVQLKQLANILQLF